MTETIKRMEVILAAIDRVTKPLQQLQDQFLKTSQSVVKNVGAMAKLTAKPINTLQQNITKTTHSLNTQQKALRNLTAQYNESARNKQLFIHQMHLKRVVDDTNNSLIKQQESLKKLSRLNQGESRFHCNKIVVPSFISSITLFFMKFSERIRSLILFFKQFNNALIFINSVSNKFEELNTQSIVLNKKIAEAAEDILSLAANLGVGVGGTGKTNSSESGMMGSILNLASVLIIFYLDKIKKIGKIFFKSGARNIAKLGARITKNVAAKATTNVAAKAVTNATAKAVTNTTAKAVTNATAKAVTNATAKATTNVAAKVTTDFAAKAGAKLLARGSWSLLKYAAGLVGPVLFLADAFEFTILLSDNVTTPLILKAFRISKPKGGPDSTIHNRYNEFIDEALRYDMLDVVGIAPFMNIFSNHARLSRLGVKMENVLEIPKFLNARKQSQAILSNPFLPGTQLEAAKLRDDEISKAIDLRVLYGIQMYDDLNRILDGFDWLSPIIPMHQAAKGLAKTKLLDFLGSNLQHAEFLIDQKKQEINKDSFKNLSPDKQKEIQDSLISDENKRLDILNLISKLKQKESIFIEDIFKSLLTNLEIPEAINKKLHQKYQEKPSEDTVIFPEVKARTQECMSHHVVLTNNTQSEIVQNNTYNIKVNTEMDLEKCLRRFLQDAEKPMSNTRPILDECTGRMPR